MARSDTVLSWLLTLAAVSVAGVLVHREFFAPPPTAPAQFPSISDPMTFVEDWPSLLKEGVVIGDPSAPVMVVQFSDLECPFCRQFHRTLQDARDVWGDSIAYTFVHYPLRQHKLARPAARAAECAVLEGRFDEFVTSIFSKQDSLGTKSWASFAKDVGIQNSARFATCTADTISVDRIERGLALGAFIKVSGTPTVIVNGWRFPVTPPDTQFRRVVSDLLAGKDPSR